MHRAGIDFICSPELFGKMPEPQRANRFVPEWFRRLNRKMDGAAPGEEAKLTIKSCMPVTDVFALGYILPLAFDVTLDISPDRRTITTHVETDCPITMIEPHKPGQIGAFDPPFEDAMPMKFINPWRIMVPDGYSVLFTPPLSRPDLPFLPFSGLVDCDRFATNVNIPFVWKGETGRHTVAAGTPIAHCVPVLRDAMIKEHVARAATPQEMDDQAAANQRKYGEQGAYTRVGAPGSKCSTCCVRQAV